MAFQALGWLQRTIGIDITGEAEFQENRTTALHKKEDEPTPETPAEPPPPKSTPRPPTLSVEVPKGGAEEPRPAAHRSGGERRHRSRKHVAGDKTLGVTPTKFYFPLPLDKYIMNALSAVNNSDGFVQFKVKATAPARYAVKPRQGVLGPREQLEIHVTLRPTKDDPEEMKDKFLIQYRLMTSEEVTDYQSTGDLQAVWQGKKDIMGTKIRCKFTSQLPPNFVVKSVAGTQEEEEEEEDGPPQAFQDEEEDEEDGDILQDRPMSALTPHLRHTHRLASDFS
eukprot:EG_transcript_20627